MTREAYAEAFRHVTGRPLVRLPQVAGRLESEIFFDALALNGVTQARAVEELLAPFSHVLAHLRGPPGPADQQGQVLPARREAVAGVARLPGWCSRC